MLDESHDIWGLAKWGKGHRNYPTPAICQRDGTSAVDHEAKGKALQLELFQPPPIIPSATFPDLNTPHSDDMTWIPFTQSEIRKTIYSPSLSKATVAI